MHFLHWTLTNWPVLLSRTMPGSLRSFNIFRQQAARAHLVIKSVWSANIAGPPMHVVRIAQLAHARTHTHTNESHTSANVCSSLKNVSVRYFQPNENTSFDSIKNSPLLGFTRASFFSHCFIVRFSHFTVRLCLANLSRNLSKHFFRVFNVSFDFKD